MANGETRKSTSPRQLLEQLGRDLTADARADRLDPTIGRDEEIRRTIQILSRRTKNNPVLIGEPGVGKTAIAEGLAQRIASGDVPQSLRDRQIISLDIGALVAGTKYVGTLEERLGDILKEVVDSEGQIILFIDEIHTIVGAGASENSSMDVANLLKPMLARGELRCIGATTLDEYRKYIEKDTALERRFQQIYVDQPGVEDTISILRGLKERYEVHHGVRITDSALVAAAMLSNRYISDRFLPDKAIDSIDEAAARLKMELTSKPIAIDEVDRKILQLEMERLSLQKEPGAPAQERRAAIEVELETNRATQETLSDRWEAEKSLIEAVQTTKAEIDRVHLEIAAAKRDYNLTLAAELEYGKLARLQEQLYNLESNLTESQIDGKNLLREEVTEEDVAITIAQWTGIPIGKLLASEQEKLLELKEFLAARVIGQGEAVTAVANVVRLARTGLTDPDRPVASFMFLGPTGVGKTELAKALAAHLFDTEAALVRIDMSEYADKNSCARLIGAPPGYVGYDEGGQLTEAVRHRPFSVVLFDELEKAHPEIFNVMLQLLDDGRLTDGKGRTVDFTNAIIIMTSNVGAQAILEIADDESRYEEMRDRVLEALRQVFRPEFLNRIDDSIVFRCLQREQLRAIVRIQVRRFARRLGDRNITLHLTDAALDFLVECGFDPVYGARPLKRAIRRELEIPISEELLQGRLQDGDNVSIDFLKDVPGKDGELTLRVAMLSDDEMS